MSKNPALAGIFQNLEQQQLKAVELMDANQHVQAFRVLQLTIQARRQKQNYPILEDLGKRIIECGIQTGNLQTLKEVLTHFRNICQHQSPDTIRRVFDHYRNLLAKISEELASNAFDEIEDIEREKIPEEVIMLSFQAEEQSEESSPQAKGKLILESYKIILEILRNNSQMLDAYNLTASKAFEFCAQHSRRNEFKRLCDFLRNHLQQIIENEKKTPEQLRNVPHPMRLTDTQTTQFVLDLREKELEIAMKMQLTKDAYSVIQDIKFLLQRIGRKMEKRKLKDYLGMVGKVFLEAKYYLYFAEACSLQLGLSMALQEDEKVKKEAAELAVISTLAISQASETDSINKVGFVSNKTLEYQAAKNSYERNSALLNSNPSRISLIKDVKHHLPLCGVEVVQLYELLQQKLIKPTQISENASRLLEEVEKKFSPSLANIIKEQLCLRVLTLLSQSYSSMKLQSLKKLLPFISFAQALSVITRANQRKLLIIEVNFKRSAVFFRAPSQSGHQLTATTLKLVEMLAKLSKTLAIVEQREYAGISEDARRRAVKKASENIEEDKEQIKEQQKLKQEAGHQHQQKVKIMNEAILEDQKNKREKELREREENKMLEQNQALLKRLLLQREDIKKSQRQEYIKDLKERGVKFNENAETQVLLEELEKADEKEKFHLKSLAAKTFKQCNMNTIARKEMEFKKMSKIFKEKEEERQARIVSYFKTKHEEELQMKKKFDIFIIHHGKFFEAQKKLRKEKLEEEMKHYLEKKRQTIKAQILSKAKQLQEAAERKKRIKEVEKQRELKNEQLKQKALDDKEAANADRPGKRMGFGSAKVEGQSENIEFKRGGGAIQSEARKAPESSDLAGFGFGKKFTFIGKGTDQDWKKGGEKKSPVKAAAGAGAGGGLQLPPPREQNIGSKLSLPPPREDNLKGKMTLPPQRQQPKAAAASKEEFKFGSFKPGGFKNTKKEGEGSRQFGGGARTSVGGAGRGKFAGKVTVKHSKFESSDEEQEGAGDGFSYSSKHGK